MCATSVKPPVVILQCVMLGENGLFSFVPDQHERTSTCRTDVVPTHQNSNNFEDEKSAPDMFCLERKRSS